MKCFALPSLFAPTFTVLPRCAVTVRVSLANRFSQLHESDSVIRAVAKTRAAGNGGAFDTETAVVEKPQLETLFQVSRGYPSPFGATVRDGGVNFAIYSLNALSATLCLFTLSDFQNVSHYSSLRVPISENEFNNPLLNLNSRSML